jgi:hypothetical protein
VTRSEAGSAEDPQVKPSPWYVQRAATWSEFVRLAEASDTNTPTTTPTVRPILFRGQSNGSWGLEPSLLRAIDRAKVNDHEFCHLERLAVMEFRSQAHLFVPGALLSETTEELDWWMLMQHYGAPTRALDWTLSPFVAAYFAVRDQPGADGAVWWVNGQALERLASREIGAHDAELTRPILDRCSRPTIVSIEGKLRNERMIAQQGLLTVSSHPRVPHHDAIQQMLSHTVSVTFGRWEIPAELKQSFLWHLNSMNITARSLFPGLDGLGRSVADLVRLWANKLETNEFYQRFRPS